MVSNSKISLSSLSIQRPKMHYVINGIMCLTHPGGLLSSGDLIHPTTRRIQLSPMGSMRCCSRKLHTPVATLFSFCNKYDFVTLCAWYIHLIAACAKSHSPSQVNPSRRSIVNRVI